MLPIVTELRRADPALRDRARCGSSTDRRCCAARTAGCRAGCTSTCAAATSCRSCRDLQAAVAREVKLPPGYSVSWSGQFEYLERAKRSGCGTSCPLTLVVIFVLLYLAFRRVDEALLIMLAVPFALVGGFWLLWLLGYSTSVATRRRASSRSPASRPSSASSC